MSMADDADDKRREDWQQIIPNMRLTMWNGPYKALGPKQLIHHQSPQEKDFSIETEDGTVRNVSLEELRDALASHRT
jgi:hypothetical protein